MYNLAVKYLQEKYGNSTNYTPSDKHIKLLVEQYYLGVSAKKELAQAMPNRFFGFDGLDIISREQYETLPCGMYAYGFTDEQMQQIAQEIYDTLHSQYGFDKNQLREYFTDYDPDSEIDDPFWREMEDIAVKMGMVYYDDMTDEEYQKIKNSAVNADIV